MAHDHIEQLCIVVSVKIGDHVISADKAIIIDKMGLEREAELVESHVRELGTQLAESWIRTGRGSRL